MICSKNNMQTAEKVHNKTLQVVYNSYMATQEELLALDNNVKIHQRHLQFLAIEIYKSENKLNPSFMWEIYKVKNIPYSLRRGISLFTPNVNTQKYGIKSLNFRESILRNNQPIKLREFKSPQEIKFLLNQCENLPCNFLAHKA